jgi:DNA-binding LacI/PurR family transcriptional regulator
MSAPQLKGSSHRATSYDVARIAGVAQSTVSRCFQDESNISLATRQRVMSVARDLGYVPNALARSLITQRSNLVGVVIARYTLRNNPDVIYAVGDLLTTAGKRALLVTVQNDFPSVAELRGVLEYPLDGLISCVMLAPEHLSDLRARHLPIVFYNRDPGPAAADCVMANHFAAAGDVAEALHGAGHRRFLCVGGPPDAFVGRQRTAGFLGRLAALGVTSTHLLATDFSYAQGRQAFLGHIAEAERPDAVFCANDQIAMGVIDACQYDLNWRVPNDLSVVGFDGVAEAARPAYNLTTLHQDSAEIGRQAVRLLLLRLANTGAPWARNVVPAKLIVRGSARLPKN